MKTITNLIIVDASGSMQNKVYEVKDGLKQLFTDIKKDAKKDKGKVEQNTIVVDFSSSGDIRTLVNSKGVTKLKNEVADGYSPRGMTALYDAIGNAFSLVPKKQKFVFVSIITDGEENDSKEYDFEKIKKLMEDKKKFGWAITFMGTTEDAINKAVSFGVSRGNTMTFMNTSDGMIGAAGAMGTSRGMYYYSNTSAGSLASLTPVNSDTLLEDAQKQIDKKKKKEVKKDI